MTLTDGQMQELKQEFIALCQGIQREGIDRLLDWLEKSDFYTAPAGTRFHGSHKGGLLMYSLKAPRRLPRSPTTYLKSI